MKTAFKVKVKFHKIWSHQSRVRRLSYIIFWSVVFSQFCADGQTDRQTDRHIHTRT